MVKLKVITDKEKKATENVVKSAISAQIQRLEISLKITNNNLKKFEEKYFVNSDEFLKKYTAEDLEGKDEEYVNWYGEIKMKEKIFYDLKKLQAIEYDSN